MEEARGYGILVPECLGDSNSPSDVPGTQEESIGYYGKQEIRDLGFLTIHPNPHSPSPFFMLSLF